MNAPTRRLGQTELMVSRLGIGSSYGVSAGACEAGFYEGGINLFYWGSIRKPGMKKAIRNLASERDKLVIVLQSYDRTGRLLPYFHERGLRALRIDHADLLLLGWYNGPPPRRVLAAARELKRQGKVRYLALSGHNRAYFGALARDPDCPVDVFMVRYNAAHPGAEQDIFPHLGAQRPGVMAYTATCWRRLLQARRMPRGEPPMSATDCYRFCLSHPQVDLCMTGPSNEAQLREAMRALELGPLDPQEMARARRIGAFVHG